MIDREKVIDGIERLRFFNQRAGRELWGDKPTETQNHDIADADSILDDALALLKEQEARVMTREEIRAGEIETLWIEVKGKPHIFPGIWYRRSKKDGIPAIDITLNTGIVRGTVVSYGYAWRCWTSRPTEEQRKAVKWDET